MPRVYVTGNVRDLILSCCTYSNSYKEEINATNNAIGTLIICLRACTQTIIESVIRTIKKCHNS